MSCWQIFVFIVFLFITVFSSPYCSAAKETSFVNNTKSKIQILAVFGHLGKSHFEVFKPLLEELARRGHYLTVISHFPRSEDAKIKEALPNYKDISLLDPKVGTFIDVVDIRDIQRTLFYFVMNLRMLRQMADVACHIGLNNPAVGELLRSNERFDLILTEGFNTDCFLGFVSKFNVPYIILSSHTSMPWIKNNIGDEDNPSYIPLIGLGFTRPMIFLDRVINTLQQLTWIITYDYHFRPNDQAIVDEVFGPDLSNLKEVSEQAMALFVNTHSSLFGNVPHLPNVVEVGGIHISDRTNLLPKDVADFLDSAPEGLLYFSFGSMIKMATVPQKKLDIILEILGSLPRKVIWKWEDDVLPRKLNNVMVRKWLPQLDVLSKQWIKLKLTFSVNFFT